MASDEKLDIDELAQKIENRIKELEQKEIQEEKETKHNQTADKHILELDEIINEIDRRISELEKNDNTSIDIEDLTQKVNKKLAKIENDEDDLDRTISGLSEISDSINGMMKNLEAKRKKRKKLKAMYCDLARKKARTLKFKKIKSSS